MNVGSALTVYIVLVGYTRPLPGENNCIAPRSVIRRKNEHLCWLQSSSMPLNWLLRSPRPQSKSPITLGLPHSTDRDTQQTMDAVNTHQLQAALQAECSTVAQNLMTMPHRIIAQLLATPEAEVGQSFELIRSIRGAGNANVRDRELLRRTHRTYSYIMSRARSNSRTKQSVA